MILIDSDGKYIAHMVSTQSLDELHEFAKGIGLKRAWFQNKKIPHYDLTTRRKIQQAMDAGAKLVRPRELSRRAYVEASVAKTMSRMRKCKD